MMTPVSAGMGSASQVAPWEVPDGPCRGDWGPVTFQSQGGGRNGAMAPGIRLQKVEAFGKGVALPWGSWGTRRSPAGCSARCCPGLADTHVAPLIKLA